MRQIAVLGLGIIGGGIAKNILSAGFPLTVYNRSQGKTESFAAQGANVAATPREAAANADIVIAAVADDAASEAVWLGKDGALGAAKEGAILVECSTLSTPWVGRLAAATEARGLRFVDAPVLGSKDAADAGQLRLLVGGEAATVEQARDVLAAFSAEINHLGPVGSGARLKLINNAMAAVQIIAFAEGLVLAERAGLKVDQVVNILQNGAPGSPMVKGRAARMAAHEYDDVHFALRWMLKDTEYGVDEGTRFNVPMSTVAVARDALQAAVDQGLGDLDLAAVVEVLRRSQ